MTCSAAVPYGGSSTLFGCRPSDRVRLRYHAKAEIAQQAVRVLGSLTSFSLQHLCLRKGLRSAHSSNP